MFVMFTKKNAVSTGYTFTGKNGRVVRLGAPLPPEVTGAMVQEMERRYDLRHPPPPPPPKPGDLVPGQGIYLGQYTPKDRDGNSLSKTFNVFAAPEDLPERMTYIGAVEYIAQLKNWHGHDGTNYATDKEFYDAVKNGSYNGGWIVPTYGILSHKDKGALLGTLRIIAANPDWY